MHAIICMEIQLQLIYTANHAARLFYHFALHVYAALQSQLYRTMASMLILAFLFLITHTSAQSKCN